MNLTRQLIREIWIYIPKKTKRKLIPAYKDAYAAEMKIFSPILMKNKAELRLGLLKGSVDLKTRKKTIVRPRQAICYILRKTTDMSLDKIGNVFEIGIDHATVLHGIRKIENAKLGYDPELLDVFNKVSEAVGYEY